MAIGLSLLAFLPGLNGPFFGDDKAYLVENPVLTSIPLTESWRIFTTRTNPFEFLPLRDLSYRIDWALFGLNPVGYRVHNMLLYALACLACWLCILEISRFLMLPDGARRAADSRPAWIAAAGTALFAVHPAHVEAVLWISGRKDLLSGLLVLLALWLFVTGLQERRGTVMRQAGAAVLFFLALLAKSTVLPVAVVALLLSLACARRRDRSGDETGAGEAQPLDLRRAMAPALPLVVIGLAAFLLHIFVGAETGILKEGTAAGGGVLGGSLLLPVQILGHLARIAVIPVRLRLIYDLQEPGWEMWLAYLMAAAALVGLVAGLRALFLRRSVAGFGVVTFVVLCLPFLQIIPFKTWSLVGERFLFLPIFGLALAAGAVLVKVDTRVAWTVLTALTAGFLATSIARSLDWRSAEALLVNDVAYSPRHQLAVEPYIDHLLPQGRHAEALAAAGKVRNEIIRGTLEKYVQAREAAAAGDRARAVSLVKSVAAAMDWDSPLFHLKVANLALEVGEPQVAADIYRAVLDLRPFTVAIRYNLGLALKRLGRLEAAAAEIDRSIRDGLRGGMAWNNLGLIYRDLGRTEDSEAAFLSGLRDDPAHWHAAYNLARLYLSQGDANRAHEMLNVARERALRNGDDTGPIDALLRQLGPGSRSTGAHGPAGKRAPATVGGRLPAVRGASQARGDGRGDGLIALGSSELLDLFPGENAALDEHLVGVQKVLGAHRTGLVDGVGDLPESLLGSERAEPLHRLGIQNRGHGRPLSP
jgi:tetratricopeptide (TPR) repeat protein